MVTHDFNNQIFLHVWFILGSIESCKIVKDKNTGESAGYGFAEFGDHFSAALAKQHLNGRIILGTEFKLT